MWGGGEEGVKLGIISSVSCIESDIAYFINSLRHAMYIHCSALKITTSSLVGILMVRPLQNI